MVSQQQQQHRREPDLILRPYEEGVNFTLKLIEANPSAKVVEVDCRSGSSSPSNDDKILTSNGIWKIFRAIGGNNDDGDDYYDEGNGGEDEDDGDGAFYGDGLRYMESLSVIGDNDKSGSSTSWCRYSNSSSSFLKPITSLLVNTGQQQQRQTKSSYFNRLCLMGVNLEGSILDFRAMVECLRIHPIYNTSK